MAQDLTVSLKEAEYQRLAQAAEEWQLTVNMTLKALALQRLRQLEDGGPGAIIGGD